jgi:hypothetical protein
LECLGAGNTCGSDIFRAEECLKNDMTKLPNNGLQPTLLRCALQRG